jgi:3-hydroxybutyryl-CoA dehydrogenase
MNAQLPGRAAVLGGGTMGAGIATTFALAGVSTTVIVRRAEALQEASERIGARLQAHVSLGLVDAEALADARRRIEMRVGLGGGPYDVVCESIAEDAAAKRDVLSRAETALAEDGVLSTNTSSLSLSDLAAAVSDPGRFAGWHWFHPADLVELVEIVPGPGTRDVTLELLAGWSRSLGKTPVVLAREVEGFVGNRLQYALLREAYALVADGVCTVADVDAAVTAGLGPRWAAVGPFASMDLAGLELHAAVVEALFPHLSRDQAVPELLTAAVGKGALGADSGAGLRGTYTAEEAAAQVEVRDRSLAARRRGRR